MGDWGSVTYVHTCRRDHLEETVARLVEREGYGRVKDKDDAPSLRAVILGARGGWTAVKFSDSEFMVRRRAGQERPRISELAVVLARHAFQVSVFDGDSMTLVEASRTGRVCVSGGEAATASRRYHAETIKKKYHFDPGFHLLPVREDLENVAGDWMEVAALLVPGVEADLVATDSLFAKARAPELPSARWLSFAKKKKAKRSVTA